MKKSGLLAAAMMAAVVIGGCQTAEEKPVYNFSTRFPNASEAYGVQYGDTLYFISLYNSFYRVRNDSVSLLEEDFGGWSLTQLKNTLYYINGSSIYRNGKCLEKAAWESRKISTFSRTRYTQFGPTGRRCTI